MWRNLKAEDYAWLLGNCAVVLVIIFLLLKAAGVRFLDDSDVVSPKKSGERDATKDQA
jgi:hypothetical protein